MSRDVRMRRAFCLVLLPIVTIGMANVLSAVVRANVLMMRPEAEHTKYYNLDQGDIIAWDWELIGDGEVDFWIEDGEGTRYEFVDNATSDSGSFETPWGGTWRVKFRNDSPDPEGVTISYSISINPPSTGWAWVAATVTVIVVVTIVIFILVSFRKKRKQV